MTTPKPGSAGELIPPSAAEKLIMEALALEGMGAKFIATWHAVKLAKALGVALNYISYFRRTRTEFVGDCNEALTEIELICAGEK